MKTKAGKFKPIYISRTKVGELFLGLSGKTLANWNSEGKGPRPYYFGRKVFYKTTDLEKLITSNSKEVAK